LTKTTVEVQNGLISSISRSHIEQRSPKHVRSRGYFVHTVKANRIDIHYERFGKPVHPTLLLLHGMGGQMISWQEEFCELLASRNLQVIRFDARDTGLSAKFPEGPSDREAMRHIKARKAPPPYTLSDMAADAKGLLNALGIRQAHIAGHSMGGMVSQLMAIEYPETVLSLCSIGSTTGDPDTGQSSKEALAALTAPPPGNREEAIEAALASYRIIGTQNCLDEKERRTRAEEAYDRCFYPTGRHNHMLAIIASPSRVPDLKKVTAPTVVIHGEADPLVNISGGRQTAESVPEAIFKSIPGMGHDVPRLHWPVIVQQIIENTQRATGA